MSTESIPIEAWKVLANGILDGTIHNYLATSKTGKCCLRIQSTSVSDLGKTHGLYDVVCTQDSVQFTIVHTITIPGDTNHVE